MSEIREEYLNSHKYIGSDRTFDFLTTITYNTENDRVHLSSEPNSFGCSFYIKDIDEVIRLFEWIQDYEEYDDDTDEYYAPEEVELSDDFIGWEDFQIEDWHGNYLEVWTAKYLVDNLYDLKDKYGSKIELKELTTDRLKEFSFNKLRHIYEVVKESMVNGSN